jgi:hypothetical protein
MAKDEGEWTLWSDDPIPVSRGTETEIKQKYEERVAENLSMAAILYLQDPEGNEWVFDGRRWVAQ